MLIKGQRWRRKGGFNYVSEILELLENGNCKTKYLIKGNTGNIAGTICPNHGCFPASENENSYWVLLEGQEVPLEMNGTAAP